MVIFLMHSFFLLIDFSSFRYNPKNLAGYLDCTRYVIPVNYLTGIIPHIDHSHNKILSEDLALC